MDLVTEIRKIPPVTRFAVGSLIGVTLPVILNIVSFYQVLYHKDAVFKKFQLWRLYTSYFLGSAGISFIFEIAMLYRTTYEIESRPYAHKSGDLAWQLFIACISILIMSIPLNNPFYFRPLFHCLTYLHTKLAPVGSLGSLFGLLTYPIEYTPYIMLGIELLMGGPGAVARAVPGVITGHLWWWGVWGSAVGGRGGVLAPYAQAPEWLERYLRDRPPVPGGGPGAGEGANQGGGIRVIPPRRLAGDNVPAGSRTTGYNWGQGQRLGSK